MRTSTSQFELMVDMMQNNGDLSKPGEGPNGRISNIKKWAELTELLNADATGDQRTSEKWRKVWSDFKNNIKRKAARCYKAASGTGGGPASKIKLSNLEERVLNIIGPQAAIGMMDIVEVGLQDDPSTAEIGPQAAIVMEVPPIEIFSQPLVVPQVIGASECSSDFWHQPSTSTQPYALLPPSAPEQPVTTPTIRRRRLTTRRRLVQTSPTSPRRSRPATQSELARIQFLKADTEWRKFQMERERQAAEQQARWQELFAQFVTILSKYVEKK